MGISLGVADKAPDAEIARTVQWLLNKPAARREMREHADCRCWTGRARRALPPICRMALAGGAHAAQDSFVATC